jgi:hypothetical protein
MQRVASQTRCQPPAVIPAWLRARLQPAALLHVAPTRGPQSPELAAAKGQYKGHALSLLRSSFENLSIIAVSGRDRPLMRDYSPALRSTNSNV